MTYLQIKTLYDNVYSEYVKRNKEYEDFIAKIDNKYNEIYEFIRINLVEDYENLKIKNSKSLSDMLKDKTPSGEFSNYIFSYFETLIVSRNHMICNNKPIVIYSYLFSLVMFLELVFKYAIISNNEKFIMTKAEKYWKNHNIKQIVEKNKNNFLTLGLDKSCYDLLYKEINYLREMTNIEDIAQAFRYPIGKDYLKPIINTKLLDINMVEIKKIVEKHKELLYVALMIYHLICIDNLKWLCDNTLTESYMMLEDIFDKIKKDIKNKMKTE